MKVEFTPTGGTKATLADDASKHVVVLEELGGEAGEQVAPLFRGANPSRFPRGNVAGAVVFTAAKSHSTRDAAAAQAVTEYARLNQKGSLVFTIDTTVLTMAGAVLKSVRVQLLGTRLSVVYTFGITTLTSA